MSAEPDYRDLFLQAPFGYITTEVDGVVLDINDTLLEWIGRERSDIVGTDFSALLTVGSATFAETRQQPVLLMQDEVQEVALSLQRADGTALHVLANSHVVRGPDGEATSVRMALLDSSQRRDYERSLLQARRAAEASEARLRVLQRAAAAFTLATTEEELAASLVASVIGAFDAATATVLLRDDSGKLAPIAGGPVPAADGPLRTAFENLTFVGVANLTDAEQLYPTQVEAMRAERFDAITAVPLLHEGAAFGVLVCTFGRPRIFDDGVVALQTALALQAAQVIRRLRLQAQLELLATHDPLTGLANRRLLLERTDEALAAATRSGRPLSVIFFDLDGFKAVNDTLGHGAGDSLLASVADRLRSSVRSGDFAARWGGDEFVVLCEDAGPDAAIAVAERIRQAVSQPFPDVDLPVTASIGVTVLTADDDHRPVAELFERADAAMYASKSGGRNRVTLDVLP